MDVKVKKLSKDAVIPKYSKSGDAGLDLTAVSKDIVICKEVVSNSISSIQKIKYGFGLAFEIPKGYVGYIFPRSSIYKTGQSLSNCVGVIDSGYRGEVSAVFNTNQSLINQYKIVDRVAQLIIMPVPKINLIPVKNLQSSERGSGGYGSTGN